MGVLLGGGACFALFFQQLDGAQDALFERVEVIGSNGEFGIFQYSGGHRVPHQRGKFELFFGEYSWFYAEENDGKRMNAEESNYFDTDMHDSLCESCISANHLRSLPPSFSTATMTRCAEAAKSVPREQVLNPCR